MIGISYLAEEQAATVRERITQLCEDDRNFGAFWEEALYDQSEGKMIIRSKLVKADDVVEINTYEQLRELDKDFCHLQSDAIEKAAETLGVEFGEYSWRQYEFAREYCQIVKELLNCSRSIYVMDECLYHYRRTTNFVVKADNGFRIRKDEI